MTLADDLLKAAKDRLPEHQPDAPSVPSKSDVPVEVSEEVSEVETTAAVVARLAEGRTQNNIPEDDPYWPALRAHQAAYHNSKK